MTGQLVFKKAFGIDQLPIWPAFWLMELRGRMFTVSSASGGPTFTIEVGKVGIDRKEKFAIGLFKHSDERDPRMIGEIPTINISAAVEVNVPDDLDEQQIGSADAIVEPFIMPAFVALQHFLEAYRDVKYRAARGTHKLADERGVIMGEIPLSDFSVYLFYSLIVGTRSFVGSFSKGSFSMVTPDDEALAKAVADTMAAGVPLARVLMLRAWEHYFGGDFRSAVVEAATVIELTIGGILQSKLLAQHAASEARIKKFIDDTSNRHLITVIGGLFGIDSPEWRESVARTLDTRHALVHGRKRYAAHGEAKLAVENAERLLTLAEQPPKAGSIVVPAQPGTGGAVKDSNLPPTD